MKHKFNQMVVAPDVGDCMKAATASFLDLHYDMVPHFILWGDGWWHVFYHFLWSCGYELNGTATLERHNPKEHNLNGLLLATVNSRKLEGRTHLVVVDAQTGIVIHDPGESKSWQGEEVIKSKLIVDWFIIDERTDEAWIKEKKYHNKEEIESLFMKWDSLLKLEKIK
jgi:hypothetical protein